jgi:hypothetical protein
LEFAPANDLGTHKRRSTRIVQAVPITVAGVDALGQPFRERTATVIVSCHGCKYQSKHYVPKNSMVVIEIPRPESGKKARSAKGRVTWVQRPRSVRELFQIGLEFEIAGNVWGVAFPPNDWIPLPGGSNRSAEEAGAEHRSGSASSSGAETTPPPPNKVAVMPRPSEDSLGMLRQMARLATNAQEQSGSRENFEGPLHEAVENALHNSRNHSLDRPLDVVTQDAAHRAVREVEDAAASNSSTSTQLDNAIRQAIETAVDSSVSRVAEIAMQQAAEQLTAEALQAAVRQAVDVAVHRTVADHVVDTQRQGDEARDLAQRLKKEFEDAVASVRALAVEGVNQETAESTRKWREELAGSLQSASATLRDNLNEVSRSTIAQVDADLRSQGEGLRSSFEEFAAETQKQLQALSESATYERQRAEQSCEQIEETAKNTLEQTRLRLEAMIAFQGAEVERRAENLLAYQIRKIEPALESSTRKILETLTASMQQEMQQQMSPQMKRAKELVDTLKAAADRAEAASKSIDARIEAAAVEAVQKSIDQIDSHAATFPEQVEEACKAVVTRMDEEVEAKKAEATHSTIESLYKAADWYQKKSQAGMQTALERTVEQSANSMRDRAAETSQAFTTELEHYTRSYVDLARSQIDDATKQAAERNREQLVQSTHTVAAGFQDELHRTASQNLQRFEQSARESMEQIAAEMARRQATSLQELDRRIEERIAHGVQQAQTQLESQLVPLLGSWQEKQQAAQHEALARFQKTSDDSIGQFRARLENASNSWLLASATTLGQRSQAVIETLGLAAEKRLREICANVMSSVGETLRDRLSTGAGPSAPASSTSVLPKDSDK